MKVDLLNIPLILVALITTLGAWATQRSASKALHKNARFTAETEAYDRARKLDVATIERQDKEYEELEARYKALRESIEKDNK